MAGILLPKPGMVIRYDYLWADDATAGKDAGKDRPTCLVAASDATANPRFVVLLPITHTPPTGATVGVEIPQDVKKKIGMDDAPSWIIVSEHNVDLWPNGGLSPVPGRGGAFHYGFISPGLFAKVKEEFIRIGRSGKSIRR